MEDCVFIRQRTDPIGITVLELIIQNLKEIKRCIFSSVLEVNQKEDFKILVDLLGLSIGCIWPGLDDLVVDIACDIINCSVLNR